MVRAVSPEEVGKRPRRSAPAPAAQRISEHPCPDKQLLIYWLDDAEEAAPTAFEVRILTICRALLHIPLAFVPTFAAHIFHALCSHLTRTHEHRTHIRRRTMAAASSAEELPEEVVEVLNKFNLKVEHFDINVDDD